MIRFEKKQQSDCCRMMINKYDDRDNDNKDDDR